MAGSILFTTNNEFSEDSKPNKEMKLLFDTILSTFDYY